MRSLITSHHPHQKDRYEGGAPFQAEMLSSLDAGSWQSSLSFITDTLLSVPVQNLPFVIPHLAPTLASCKNVFSVCGSHGQEKANSGLDILTHKYKTQITSLLNGKDIGGRWAAVVLIKMTIEAGPAVLLPEIKQWSRGLLGILAVCTLSGYSSRHATSFALV